jgi:hypothetical protein
LKITPSLAAASFLAIAFQNYADAAESTATTPRPLRPSIVAGIDYAQRAGDFATAAEPAPSSAQLVSALDGIADDRFGTAVAVWGDTAFIASGVWSYNLTSQNREGEPGSKDEAPAANQMGAVYVFHRQGGAWTQTQKLRASDASNYSNFGSSLAFDGSTLLVASLNANVGGVLQEGAVYAFSLNGDTWEETQKFSASDGADNWAFGSAVALRGSTAVIGALNATVGSNTSQGKAYVFTKSDGVWSQTQVLMADDGSFNDRFGQSVAFDGSSILIGAPTLPYNPAHGGFVYTFEISGNLWSQTGKLVPDDSAVSDQFGYSVALDGSSALIGSIGNQFARGAVYAFSRTDGIWQQAQKIMPDESSSGDQFGNAISMLGSKAVVGAQASVTDSGKGRAFVLSVVDDVWNAGELEQDSPGPLDLFGSAVAFDGATFLIGAPGASVGDNATQGTASFYVDDAADGIFSDGFETAM